MEDISAVQPFANFNTVPNFVKKFDVQGRGTLLEKLDYTNFMRITRLLLSEIGQVATLYGSHSFRRGGAQYLNQTLKWPIVDICRYGGWSTKYQLILAQYLIGVHDEQVILSSMPHHVNEQ